MAAVTPNLQTERLRLVCCPEPLRRETLSNFHNFVDALALCVRVRIWVGADGSAAE